ncbi:hypothetical protein PMAYCL1PPCAC_22745, partial [Pristionchus mayeri]
FDLRDARALVDLFVTQRPILSLEDRIRVPSGAVVSTAEERPRKRAELLTHSPRSLVYLAHHSLRCLQSSICRWRRGVAMGIPLGFVGGGERET